MPRDRQPIFFIAKPTSAGKNGTGIHAEHAVYLNAEGKRLYWSAPFPLPDVGDRIVITMNQIGPGIVRGYFSEGAYVGVMTQALKPPAWLRRQNKANAKRADMPAWWRAGIGTEFGAEIALPKPKPRGKQTRLTKAEAAAFKSGGGSIDTATAARLLNTSESEVEACLQVIHAK